MTFYGEKYLKNLLISDIFRTFANEHLDVSIGVHLALCGGRRSLLSELGNGIYGTTPYNLRDFFSGQLIGLKLRVLDHSVRCLKSITQHNTTLAALSEGASPL